MIDEEKLKREVSSKDLEELVENLGIETLLDLVATETNLMTFEVTFMPRRYKAFDNFLGVKDCDWKKIKYFDEAGNRNSDLGTIPNNKGGIYIYYIKPDEVPLDNYYCIMYVGRAHYGEGTQNLRKRVYSYEAESKDMYKGRIRIRELFNRYKEYLYVMYITIDGNDKIDKFEKELTAAIVPPVNSDLFQVTSKNAKNMF